MGLIAEVTAGWSGDGLTDKVLKTLDEARIVLNFHVQHPGIYSKQKDEQARSLIERIGHVAAIESLPDSAQARLTMLRNELLKKEPDLNRAYSLAKRLDELLFPVEAVPPAVSLDDRFKQLDSKQQARVRAVMETRCTMESTGHSSEKCLAKGCGELSTCSYFTPAMVMLGHDQQEHKS